ncbi:MAG: flippase [Thermoplasmata archaeon]
MLARKTVFVILKEGIAGILGFITLFFVARFMGAEPLGSVGFALAFVNVFNIVADMGFNAAHVKRMSEGKTPENCIAVYIRFKTILTVAALGILLLVLLAFELLKIQFYDSTYPEVIYIMLGYFLLTQILSIPKYTFDARLQIYRGQIAALAGAIGKDLLVISASVIMAVGTYTTFQRSIALACGYVIEVLITAIILYIFFIRNEKIGKFDKNVAKTYLKFALPFFPIAIFTILSVSADRLTIGYFWDAREVGYYTAVQQIANMLLVIQSATTLVLFPAISSAHAKGNREEIVRLSSESIRYILIILIPVGAAITVFSAGIIHVILSDEFIVAEYCFIYLTWYFILVSLASTAGTTIGGMDRPELGAKITFVSAISNIVLNFMFVPLWGATGAAIATLISGVVYFTLVRYFSRKILGFNIFGFRNLKTVFAGILTILVFYGIKIMYFSKVDEFRWYSLILLLGGVVGLFVFILWLIGEFGRKEFEFFVKSLHIGEMRKGILEELRTKNN